MITKNYKLYGHDGHRQGASFLTSCDFDVRTTKGKRLLNRLTHERSNGIKTGYWSPEKKEKLIERLAEYESTGLTPQEIYKLKADGFMEILGTIFGEEKHG